MDKQGRLILLTVLTTLFSLSFVTVAIADVTASLDVAQISVTNNLTGTPDTVDIDGLSDGDIINETRGSPDDLFETAIIRRWRGKGDKINSLGIGKGPQLVHLFRRQIHHQDTVHPRPVQGQDQIFGRFKIRIACRQVQDQRLFPFCLDCWLTE